MTQNIHNLGSKILCQYFDEIASGSASRIDIAALDISSDVLLGIIFEQFVVGLYELIHSDSLNPFDLSIKFISHTKSFKYLGILRLA